MVVTLAVREAGGSYEQLGKVTYGKAGLVVIVVSKFVYSFGCMVAYIVIVKDNFGSAVKHLLFGTLQAKRLLSESFGIDGALASFLDKQDLVTFLLSATVMLPLCLLRDMTPLEKFSAIKIVAVLFIVLIVAYLFFANPNGSVRLEGGSTFQNWFEIRKGFLER
jgi:sodium-coupled neutral amino acid transporter 11